MLSFCAGDFILLTFVLADSRITIKNLFHFYSSPVALGQIYFVLVLILTNHNTRYLYPEMEISQTTIKTNIATSWKYLSTENDHTWLPPCREGTYIKNNLLKIMMDLMKAS